MSASGQADAPFLWVRALVASEAAAQHADKVQGGLPLVADGKVIGAIGVSGVQSQQDEIVAKAGADLLA